MRPWDTDLALRLYRAMRAARRLDEMEALLAQQGEASFHLASSGHEGIAALAPHLTEADWLHPHYRDIALILARGLPPARYLHALLATAESDSQGRRMPCFVCDPALRLLSIPTLVGNNALQAVGVAAAVRDRPGRPLVLCGIGDGGSQEGEFLEAVAEAVRERLPLLFVIEDNRYALSTPTRGRTFYSRPDGEAAEFYGIPIERVDGADPAAAYARFGALVSDIRERRGPRIAVFQVERLVSHSNSDDQTVYRSAEEIAAARRRDPVARMLACLREQGVSDERIRAVDAAVEEELRAALVAARAAPAPKNGPARRPLPPALESAAAERRAVARGEGLTLIEAMRETLRRQLREDSRVSLCGQDIEDPKGDVFGLTRGLTAEAPGRVRNAPLSESTIVGAAIGRALAGERPVAFLQFADFFPLAYNQIFSELGSLYWRTNGGWEAPVILLAVTGGYRRGLGPYHAQSPEAVMAHVPGLDVFMPSNAPDAAGLLNAAFASGRPSIFFYPKNLLNDRSILADPDVSKQFVPIGKARVARAGRDLTLVGWGNTVALCERAADALEQADVSAEVIDLRTLSPWDRETVVASARRTGRLIVAHEDMRTCGLGAEILATVAEETGGTVAAARVTTPDTYLPFRYENMLALLPSWKAILERAAEMLDLELRWQAPEALEAGVVVIRAIGSSPSDETVRIVELHAKVGDTLAEGARFASVEAEKAAFEIAAPAAGTVEAILVAPGDEARVGVPIARLRAANPDTVRVRPEDREEKPVLRRRRARARRKTSEAAAPDLSAPAVLSSIASALGSREMTNDEMLHAFPHWDSADVVQRTGIERRFWIAEGENALTLAVRACRELLEREHLKIGDVDALICSTGTPLSMTPSLACRILERLSPEKGETMVQAYDINAACSGYLYALQAAYDMLKLRPEHRILVVTAETLSPVLDRTDAGTLFLFGDAATASLIARAPGRGAESPAFVHRPVLSAMGEPPEVLYVPFPGSGDCVRMEGQQVFRVAVRKMIEMLERACAEAGVGVEDLSMIVPHQANTRIIDAIRQKIKIPPERMFNHIQRFGNTSSNTIPLALREVLPGQSSGARIGLCAFGGGFTFGAAILDRL